MNLSSNSKNKNKISLSIFKILLIVSIIAAIFVTIRFVLILKKFTKLGLLNFRIISKTKVQRDPTLIWAVTSNPSNDIDYLKSITVHESGVYIVGNDLQLGNSQWRIEKRSSESGNLIWVVTQNYSDFSDSANDVIADFSGVYIVGNSGEKPEWKIEKRDIKEGNLIWSVTSALGMANSVISDDTGIYVGGYDKTLGNAQWRIEKRDKTNGELIWEVTSNPSEWFDTVKSMAIDKTGIYLVGIESKEKESFQLWRIEKRNLNDGSLIWVATSNPGVINNVYSVVVDEKGLYISGTEATKTQNTLIGKSLWRIEKRSIVDGNLIWVVNSNVESETESAEGPVLLAIDGTGLYVVGNYLISGLDSEWRIEKRNPNDGSLISLHTLNYSKGSDIPRSIAIDDSGIYIGGIDNQPDDRFPGRLFFKKTDLEWRIEKRKK